MITLRPIRVLITLAVLVFGFVAQAGAGQRMDWLDLLKRAASRDPEVRDPALKSFFGLGREFWEVEPAILVKDVASMLPLFDDRDGQVRLQVSAILATLSLGRRDGSTALAPAVPVLLDHFKDPETMVRRNVVMAIVDLKPEMPTSALQPLISMVRDTDPETADAATHGLTRLALDSSTARQALKDLFTTKEVPLHVKQVIVDTIRVAKSDQPEIIGLLSIALADNNRELVLSALRAATKLGPLAGSLRDQLQELAETTRDEEIKTSAADAVLSVQSSRR